MMRVVERRPDQVVHGRVDDHEGLARAFLDVDDARDENARIAGDQPPHLEDELEAEPARMALDDLRVGLRVGGRIVVLPVGHAETSAQVDVMQAMTRRHQVAGKLGQQGRGIVVRARGR